MPKTADEIRSLPYRPCVGVMLVNRAGRVFAGQRRDSAVDAWQMPQGGIEPGEEPVAAALRELGEETGIPPEAVELLAISEGWTCYDLPAALVPRIWGGRYRGQRQKWVLLRFLGEDAQIDIATAHPEFSRWCWLAPDEVLQRIVPFKRDTYAAVIAEFAPHL
jgi:putative (di)nucleoside polyphosphate hydrolase